MIDTDLRFSFYRTFAFVKWFLRKLTQSHSPRNFWMSGTTHNSVSLQRYMVSASTSPNQTCSDGVKFSPESSSIAESPPPFMFNEFTIGTGVTGDLEHQNGKKNITSGWSNWTEYIYIKSEHVSFDWIFNVRLSGRFHVSMFRPYMYIWKKEHKPNFIQFYNRHSTREGDTEKSINKFSMCLENVKLCQVKLLRI